MSETPKKLKDLRVTDLKQELEKRDLQTSGVKAVLADRLKTALKEEGHDPEEFDFNAQDQERKLNEDDNESNDGKETNDDDQVDENEEIIEGEDENVNIENENVEDENGDEQDENVEEVEEDENADQEEEENADQVEENMEQENAEDQIKDESEKEGNKESSGKLNDEDINNEDKTNDVEEMPESGKSGEGKFEDSKTENMNAVAIEEVSSKNEDKEPDEDSLNLMVGDEDNLFADEDKMNGAPSSPPRPETAPVKHPFTSKDTISLSSRVDKAPSENSSMRVNPDESQSVASHDSGEGVNQENSNQSTPGKSCEDISKIRNLWVSGLSTTTKAADIKSVFSAYGKVAGAKIVTNSRAPGARCYGFVTMATAPEADACIDKLNKSELGGSLIIVEKATSDSVPSRKKDDHQSSKNKDRAKSSSKTTDLRGTSSRRDERKDDRHRTGGSSSSRPSRRETSHSKGKHDLAYRGAHSALGHKSHDSHHHLSSRLSDPRRDDRRSVGRSSGGAGQDRAGSRGDRRSGPILTLNQIKDQRKKEQERDEERRKRDRDRRREEDEDRRRKDAMRRQQEAEEKLRLEREELKRERERLEKEKKEILELERERQKAERRRLERDKAELERLKRQSASNPGSRMDDRRASSKRPADERESYHGDRKRERYGGGGGREDLGGSSSHSSRGTIDRRPNERAPQSSSRYERPSARDMDPPSGARGMSSFNAPLAGGGNTRDVPPRDGHGGGGGGGSSRSGRDYNQRGGDRWNSSRDAPPSSSRDMDTGVGRDRAPDRDSSRMAGAGPRDRDGSGARFRDRDGGSGMAGNRMTERGSDNRMDRERMDGGQSFRGDRSSHHHSAGGRGGLDSRSGGSASTGGGPGHHHSSSGRARSPFHSTSSAWSSKGGSGGGGSGLGVGVSGSSYMSGGAPSSGGTVINEWNRVGGGMEAGMGGNLGGVGLAPVMRGGVGGSNLPSLGMQAYSGGGAGASWGTAMSSMQAKQLQQAAGTLMANITSSGAMLSGNRDRFDGYSSSKSNMNPRRY